MSLQARANAWDHRLYNVNRDVAHNFGTVIRELAARLDDQRWPILHELCARHNVTNEQLGRALQALCVFVQTAADHPKESMYDALVRSGWEEVPELAQVVVMAYLGSILAGYYFVGVREATIQGVGPCLTYQDLADHGRECLKRMAKSRLRRWYDRWRGRWLRLCDVLLGRTATWSKLAQSSAPSDKKQPQ